MDTGRIKMENYNNILYCEAYMDDEFRLEDLNSMIKEIRNNYSGHTDIILCKSTSYSVSIEAMDKLEKGVKEFRNFVYVVDCSAKRGSALFASESYMKPYNTRVASSKEEAYEILNNNFA